MLEQYQRRRAYLQQTNPVLKLLALLLIVLAMIPVLDPWTPLLMIIVPGLALWLLGSVPPHKFMLYLSPFTVIAFSFLWMTVVFPSERGADIWFRIGPLAVAGENVITGMSLGLRALVFASWSLLFVLTTEPTRLMLALVQHCKLPPRFGYGMMAAYRFLPLFRTELEQIRAAHRIRGLGEKPGLRGRWQQMKRYAIPLLASAIRKAERVAVAMESKGFRDSRDRSYYRTVDWSWRDAIFALGIIGLLSAVVFAMPH